MVFGLPLHPLIAHAVVVCVPLAALGAILMAFWPAAARRLWPAVLFVATIGLIAVPVTTESGEALEERVGENELVEAHAKQSEQVLPFVIVLWLAVAGICLSIYLARRASRSSGGTTGARPRWRPVAAAVLAAMALVGGIGGVAEVVLAGHGGAKAVWTKR
ncbi:hypothetical protein NE235_26515 [Actinoallomurus spadix]|uniref:DUF2231 domain-containing protein n=1 Tax=Actinoallomurus spadix TaxID=79912 RepID=A0ABN0WYH8_9ACTN|nr:DUF2231 domain-containing protein [Actinoallomurus spadix]MCO5989668.1 hypothetical protein [Actinoallomurus spadix]